MTEESYDDAPRLTEKPYEDARRMMEEPYEEAPEPYSKVSPPSELPKFPISAALSHQEELHDPVDKVVVEDSYQAVLQAAMALSLRKGKN
jgi:hypothetical protein